MYACTYEWYIRTQRYSWHSTRSNWLCLTFVDQMCRRREHSRSMRVLSLGCRWPAELQLRLLLWNFPPHPQRGGVRRDMGESFLTTTFMLPNFIRSFLYSSILSFLSAHALGRRIFEVRTMLSNHTTGLVPQSPCQENIQSVGVASFILSLDL